VSCDLLPQIVDLTIRSRQPAIHNLQIRPARLRSHTVSELQTQRQDVPHQPLVLALQVHAQGAGGLGHAASSAIGMIRPQCPQRFWFGW
jgi:hypothetical protein